MIRALFASLLVVACASPSAVSDPPDAGAPEGCDGGVMGPLGACLPPKGPCDQCGSAADCPGGQACSLIGECKFCTIQQGGADCSPNECLSGAECCSGAFCVQPDDPPPCGGACFRPPDECGEGNPCPEGSACEAVNVRCSCGGPAMMCIKLCPANPCRDDETCENAHCVPKRCPDFACGPDKVCGEPGDLNGCAPKPCTAHTDCSAGFCFQGRCRKAAGTCEFPRP